LIPVFLFFFLSAWLKVTGTDYKLRSSLGG
jgi:hypothetical protein